MSHKKIILYIMAILFFTACSVGGKDSDSYGDVIDAIEKPVNEKLPIKGSYRIIDREELVEISKEVKDKYEDIENMYISENLMAFGEILSVSPDFKSRYLNFNNLLARNNYDLTGFIEEEEGPVYTVSDGQFLYQNIMVLSDDRIAMVKDGILFIMEKYSDDVPKDVTVDAAIIEDSFKGENNKSSIKKLDEGAVFIGIKSPRKDAEDNTYYEYYTILIHRDTDKEYYIYGIEDLFIPSKDGVFLGGMDHIVEETGARDVFYYNSLSQNLEEKSYFDIGDGKSNQILYLGNGYIDIETKDYDSVYRKYRLYSLQNLEKDSSLSITDIAGEDGLRSFIEDSARAITNNNIESSAIDLVDINNLGLTRTKGVWKFKSNLIVNEKDNILVTDYMIDIVPKAAITNENMSISWDHIQNKFPDVIDAYTSTNGNLLIVQRPQEMLICSLDEGIIVDEPLFAISIGSSDKVIMDEWVSGSLVKDWVEVFMKQKRIMLQTVN